MQGASEFNRAQRHSSAGLFQYTAHQDESVDLALKTHVGTCHSSLGQCLRVLQAFVSQGVVARGKHQRWRKPRKLGVQQW